MSAPAVCGGFQRARTFVSPDMKQRSKLNFCSSRMSSRVGSSRPAVSPWSAGRFYFESFALAGFALRVSAFV